MIGDENDGDSISTTGRKPEPALLSSKHQSLILQFSTDNTDTVMIQNKSNTPA
jgi:hypothetical protein